MSHATKKNGMTQQNTESANTKGGETKNTNCSVDSKQKKPTTLTEQEEITLISAELEEEASDPIRAECKVIVEELEKKLHKIQNPTEKIKLLQSHFISLLYQHKKLTREVVLMQELCNQYKTEKEITAQCLQQKLSSDFKALTVANPSSPTSNNNNNNNKSSSSAESLSITKDVDHKSECIRLREKLSNLEEQYITREKHFAAQMNTKNLETELIKARCLQKLEMVQIRTFQVSQSYKEQMNNALKIELDLKTQLKLYAEKFEQFQDTLLKSNEAFATFKQEMERMTKSIMRLEKDKLNLQKKSEQTDVALIEMAEERNNQRRELEICKSKNTRLEALCRVLQSERRRDMQIMSNTSVSTMSHNENDVNDTGTQQQSTSSEQTPAKSSIHTSTPSVVDTTTHTPAHRTQKRPQKQKI